MTQADFQRDVKSIEIGDLVHVKATNIHHEDHGVYVGPTPIDSRLVIVRDARGWEFVTYAFAIEKIEEVSR